MPNYRISDETHRRLQRWAVPLSDSRNEVIQRVLDVAEGIAVGVENLHFHSRSRLAAAIEGFFSQGDQPMNISDIAPRLAEHILLSWLEEGGEDHANDSPDAG